MLPAPGFGQHRSMAVPPAPRMRRLQLRQPFTLAYGVRARAFHDGSFHAYRLRLTLSFDGKSLLYRREDLSTGRTVTELFDGRETYEAETGSRIAMIQPGFDVHRLWLCPLPGVGIPFAPMLTHGIPSKHLAGVAKALAPQLATESRYVSPSLFNAPGLEREYGMWADDGMAARTRAWNHAASVALVPTHGAPKVLWYTTFEIPSPHIGSLWEFFSHKRFSGVWLATSARLRGYGVRTAAGPTDLVREVTYELEHAVERPLQPNAYDPATYLSRHANVTDAAGSAVRTFLYEPGQGPLQEQRSRGVDVASEAARRVRPPINTGVVGLCVLAVLAVVWGVWRKRQTP
ncbi:MAG: hypothetical protein NT029_16490 [Armatimonadetes bacterium]|nr:hypothetical protein [Armatimonadota bacterium]